SLSYALLSSCRSWSLTPCADPGVCLSFPTRRSSDLGVVVAREQALDVTAVQHRGEHAGVERAGALLLVPHPFEGVPLEGAGVVRDRKSTRLNSSHVSISYAVFCLKKKKNT